MFDLDEDEVVDEYFPDDEENDEDQNDSSGDLDDDEEVIDLSSYKGKLSDREVKFINLYSAIAKINNSAKDGMEQAVQNVLKANPKHTSSSTIGYIMKDLFFLQSHNRIQLTKYEPDSLLSGEEVDSEFGGDGDSGTYNKLFEKEVKILINSFVDYLANRDLSEDSVVSKKRKLRQLPAFLIFCFASGLYDLVMRCPSMPKDYQYQIDEALKKISKMKLKLLDEYISYYEKDNKNPLLVEHVNGAQLSWFNKEPAELRASKISRDLKMTDEDIERYRQARTEFNSISTNLSQDMISDFIEVQLDPQKGIYERLKGKTRGKAIDDVKSELKAFVQSQDPDKVGLVGKIIFNKFD